MKRIIYTVVFAVFISGLLFTCGDPEPEDTCNAEDYCDKRDDIVLNATFCSDGESNSYYTYGGEKYTCTGVDASTCDDARAAILAKMQDEEPTCFGKKNGEVDLTAIKTKLSKTAEKLLRDVRLKSMDKGL
jgi:hypothetical protein